MNRIVSLIGYPIKHSISPAFQQAAFDYYRLDLRYEKWEIEPSKLDITINLLRQSKYLGANVTIPYKEAVIPLLDELDDLVIEIGAVNTIVNRAGKLFGYNTDAPAFIRSLREDGDFELKGKDVVLLGAGGAARAVGLAILGENANLLTVANRSTERAVNLVDSLKKKTRYNSEIRVLPWGDIPINKPVSDCDLLVNCTSIGTRYGVTEGETPLKAKSIPEHALVYDLVYNPIETPLLKEARKAGARTLGGLSMLVYQGAASFEMWTNEKPVLDLMLFNARKALGYD